MPSKIVFELRSHDAILRIKLPVAIETSFCYAAFTDKTLLAVLFDDMDSPRALYDTAIVLPTTKAIFERLAAGFSGMLFAFERLAILYVAPIHDHSPRASMLQSLTHGRVA